MKRIGRYILVGFLVALGGMFSAELGGDFFNGMDYGSAAVVGISMYLCVVIVTCTGIILSKIEKEDPPEKEDN